MATLIEWTEETWNPVTGCDRVSPGCDHCYALTLAARLKAMGSKRYQNDGDPATSGPGFGVTLHPTSLILPLRWTRPRRVFVNSMSDLFHPDIPNDYIAQVFAVMAAAPWHTFQVLTKRHGRMRSLLNSPNWRGAVAGHVRALMPGQPLDEFDALTMPFVGGAGLPNVWLGVSVEDQQRAELRIGALLDTPAAVWWLSCEPLLGHVDLTPWTTWEDGALRYPEPDAGVAGLGWVVVGGESGPHHRPVALDWVRALRDQCTDAAVPFFFKQVGGRTPKAGGRLLDGRTWDEYPPQLHP